MRGNSISVAPRLKISRITHKEIFNSLLTSSTSSPIGYDRYENSKLAKRASLKETAEFKIMQKASTTQYEQDNERQGPEVKRNLTSISVETGVTPAMSIISTATNTSTLVYYCSRKGAYCCLTMFIGPWRLLLAELSP